MPPQPTLATIAADHAQRRDPCWHFPEAGVRTGLVAICERARRFAAVLRDLGIGRGCRVALLLGNVPDYAPLLLAVWHLGAVAVPLRTLSSRQAGCERALDGCGAESAFALVVADDRVAATVLAAWRACSARPAMTVAAIAALAQTGSALPHGPLHLPPDELALILHATDRTGRPGDVLITHGVVLAQLAAFDQQVARGCRGRRVRASASWLPFSHGLGLLLGILNPLHLATANLLATPQFVRTRPRCWFALMAAQRSDLTAMTSSALKAALRPMSRRGEDDGEALDLRNLSCHLVAEKVHPAVLRQAYAVFAAHGMQPHQFRIGYAMAASAPGAASTAGEHIRIGHFRIAADGAVEPGAVGAADSVELVAVGRVHDGVRLTIRDDADRELPSGRLGEICIDGPGVAAVGRAEAGGDVGRIVGGQMRTGDLGFMHDGELWFHSRKDDLVVIRGRNIDPADVEHAVEELPFVRPNGSALIVLPDTAGRPGGPVLLVEPRSRPGHAHADGRRSAVQAAVQCGFDLLLGDVRFCAGGTIETGAGGGKRRRAIRERLCAGTLPTY